MPNLNMPGEGGGRSPVQPMMAGRDGGGGLVKKILTVVVVLIVGAGGYYLYDSGKLPFLKKGPPPPTAAELGFPPDQAMQPAAEPEAPPPQAPPPTSTPADVKPTPVTKTPPLAASTQPPATGEFTVVIGSFVDKQLADDEAARWSNAGIPAMVAEKAADGTTWYRLSIGRYETRKLAMEAAKEMEHMFENGYWVEKAR